MSRHARALLALLTFTLLPAAARADDVELLELTKTIGTSGTELEVVLGGDLGKGRPRIWITRSDDTAPKPARTRVKVRKRPLVAADGSKWFDVKLRRVRSGTGAYDLHVRPRGKGRTTTVFPAVFEVSGPVIRLPLGPQPLYTGTIGLPFHLSALTSYDTEESRPRYFLLGGTLPEPLELEGVLPEVPAGRYDLRVENDLGDATLRGRLAVSEPTLPCQDVVFLSITSAAPASPHRTELFTAHCDASLTTVGAFMSQGLEPGWTMNLVTVGENELTLKAGYDVLALAAASATDVDVPIWSAWLRTSEGDKAGGWSPHPELEGRLTIHSVKGVRVNGSFDLELLPESGAAEPVQIEGWFSVGIKSWLQGPL